MTDMNGTQIARAEAAADGTVADATPLAPGPYTAIITAIGYAPVAATAYVTASGRAELGDIVLVRTGIELPPPGRWTIDPVHSSVTAVAQHLGLSTIRGRFTTFGGHVEIAEETRKSRVAAVIQARTIDTGNDTRDEHIRSADFLDAERCPEITYDSTDLTPTDADRWIVHGELTLRGITRPVDLDLSYLGTAPDMWGGMRAAFHATTELRREDFGIRYNEILPAGIAAVGGTLRVEIDIQAAQGDTLPGA
jgi:polyisoprenoid-binding protein YceI